MSEQTKTVYSPVPVSAGGTAKLFPSGKEKSRARKNELIGRERNSVAEASPVGKVIDISARSKRRVTLEKPT